MKITQFTLVLVVMLVAGLHNHSAAQKQKPLRSAKVVSQSSAKVVSRPPASVTKSSSKVAENPALKLLSSREKLLLDEINFARANPGEYLKALEAFKKNYRGKEIHYPEGGVLVTNEGVGALDDAIKFMRGVKPMPPLDVRNGMVQAARLHAKDMTSSGKSGHAGSDGSKPGERLDRFGRWADAYGENIVYDSSTARYDVIGMIIDDGTSNRGHRENLFAADFRVVGIATGTRGNGASFAVITFAGGFQDKK